MYNVDEFYILILLILNRNGLLMFLMKSIEFFNFQIRFPPFSHYFCELPMTTVSKRVSVPGTFSILMRLTCFLVLSIKGYLRISRIMFDLGMSGCLRTFTSSHSLPPKYYHSSKLDIYASPLRHLFQPPSFVLGVNCLAIPKETKLVKMAQLLKNHGVRKLQKKNI